MPQDSPFRKSIVELGLSTKRALILGIGGGGDIVQGIPLARLFRQLGVEDIGMGGVNCQWWTPNRNPLADEWGTAVMGPTLYNLDDLKPVDRVQPQLALIDSDSRVDKRRPCEAILADQLPGDYVCVGGLTAGVVGLRDSLQQFVKDKGIELVVGVDLGSDPITDGKEAAPAMCQHSPAYQATAVTVRCSCRSWTSGSEES